MRLLLDEHYSYQRISVSAYQRISVPLEAEGHDVRAAVNDPDLREAPDPDVLAVAIREQRTLVTADTRHFSELLRQLATAGSEHAGVILVPSTIRNGAYGIILRSLRHVLLDTGPGDWTNRVMWLPRILD